MSDFDQAIDDVGGQQIAAASKMQLLDPAATSDQAARAFDLAQQTGKPAGLIGPDPRQFDEQFQGALRGEIVAKNPTLWNFVNKDPLHAQLIKDDLPQLDEATRLADNVGTGLSSGDQATAFATQFKAKNPGWEDVPDALLKGLWHSLQATKQGASTLGGSRTANPLPPNPYEQPYNVGDISNLGSAFAKTAYRLSSAFPSLAVGAVAATGASALAGPELALPAGIGGAALAMGGLDTLQSLGEQFQNELQKTPNDPNGAFDRAMTTAEISGAFSVAGAAIFPARFLKGPLKNMLFQIFGVQPALGAAHRGEEQLRTGAPQNYAEGYVEDVIGSALPALLFNGLKGGRMAYGRAEPPLDAGDIGVKGPALPPPPPPGITDMSRRRFLTGMAAVAGHIATGGKLELPLPSLGEAADKIAGYLTPRTTQLMEDYWFDYSTHMRGIIPSHFSSPEEYASAVISDLRAQADKWKEWGADAAAGAPPKTNISWNVGMEPADASAYAKQEAIQYSRTADMMEKFGIMPDKASWSERSSDIFWAIQQANNGERMSDHVKMLNLANAQKAHTNKAILDEVIKQIDSTNIFKTAPGKLRELMGGVNSQNIRIKSEALQKIYGLLGKEPSGFMKDLMSKLESQPPVKGLDVNTPSNEYVSNMPKDIHDQISDDVGLGEDQTVNEGKEIAELQAEPEEEQPEYISHSAVRVGDNIHEDTNHVYAYERAKDEIEKAGDDADVEEGYTTSNGRFVNREEALPIAQEAGQLRENPTFADAGQLYDEDMKVENIQEQAVRIGHEVQMDLINTYGMDYKLARAVSQLVAARYHARAVETGFSPDWLYDDDNRRFIWGEQDRPGSLEQGPFSVGKAMLTESLKRMMTRSFGGREWVQLPEAGEEGEGLYWRYSPSYAARGNSPGQPARLTVADVSFQHKGTGAFTAYVQHIEKLARQNGIERIDLENVENPRLIPKYISWGYKKKPGLGEATMDDVLNDLATFNDNPPSFYKLLPKKRGWFGQDEERPPPKSVRRREAGRVDIEKYFKDLEEDLKYYTADELTDLQNEIDREQREENKAGPGNALPLDMTPVQLAEQFQVIRDAFEDEMDRLADIVRKGAGTAFTRGTSERMLQYQEMAKNVPIQLVERLGFGDLVKAVREGDIEDADKAWGDLRQNLMQMMDQLETAGIDVRKLSMYQDALNRLGELFDKRMNETVFKPKSYLDRIWDNQAKNMTPEEFLESESLWGSSRDWAEHNGGTQAAAFATIANEIFERMGIPRRMSERQARVEMAKQKGITLLSTLKSGDTLGSVTIPDNPREHWSQVFRLYYGLYNFSTPVHEFFHLWAIDVFRDANRPGAAMRSVALRDGLLEWLGREAGSVTNWAELERADHERFAEAGESYLRTGEAPHDELTEAFSILSDEIKRIYSDSHRIGRPLDPRIKTVFDKMLATDTQLGQFEQQYSFMQQMIRRAGEFDLKDLIDQPYEEGKRLESMLRNPGTAWQEYSGSPLIGAYMEVMKKIPKTATSDQAMQESWRNKRTYVVGEKHVKGDDAVRAMLAESAKPAHRPIQQGKKFTLVFGPPGAGKSQHVVEPIAVANAARVIDSDDIRSCIPEYRGGVGVLATHAETAGLTINLLNRALEAGDNVVYPIVGDNTDGAEALVLKVLAAGHSLSIVHVWADPDVIARGVVRRFLNTGRIVDITRAANATQITPQTYDRLKPYADEAVSLDLSSGSIPIFLDGQRTNLGTIIGASSRGAGGSNVPATLPQAQGAIRAWRQGEGEIGAPVPRTSGGATGQTVNKTFHSLAEGNEGYSIKEIDTGDDAYQTYEIQQNGKRKGEFSITDMGRSKGEIDLLWIGRKSQEEVETSGTSLSSDANTLGLGTIRTVLGLFLKTHPDIKKIHTTRVSGTRGGESPDIVYLIENGKLVVERIESRSGVKTFRQDQVEGPFEKAKDFGRTAQMYRGYMRLINRRNAEDVAKRRERAIQMAERMNSAEWKAEIARLTPIVKQEVENRPEVAVYQAFERGEVQITKASMGETGTGGLPKTWFNKDGLPVDALANYYGYDTGDELVQVLAAMREAGVMYRGKIVDRLTRAEVQKQASDNLGFGQAQRMEEAEDDTVGLTQMELLHEKMMELGLQVGATLPLNKAATDWGALAIFHNEPFKGASFQKYLRQAGNHGRLLERAFLAGDTLEAFREAQAQYIQTQMAKLAKTLEREAKAFQKIAGRFRSREVKGVPAEYTNWIHYILMKLGLPVQRTQEDLAREISEHNETTLREFAVAKQAMGLPLSIPDYMLDPAWAKPMEQMTTKEAREAMNAVKSLRRVGRDELQVIVSGEKKDLNDLIDELTQDLESNARVTQYGNLHPIHLGRSYLAAHLTMETMFNRWAQGRTWSTMNRFLRPMLQASNEESALDKVTAAKYGKLPNQLSIRELNKPVNNTIFKDPLLAWVPQSGTPNGRFNWANAPLLPLRRRHVRTILLNAGNSDNLRRLAEGYGLEPQQVMDWVLQNTTKEDWEWAQAHGDIFADLKSQADDMYRRLGDVAPKSIELAPIQAHGKVWKGWYHPVIHHPYFYGHYVDKAGVTSALFAKEYIRAGSANAYTKDRTGYRGPMSLELDAIPARLYQEIHDIAFREAIINTSKVFYNNRFRNQVLQHYGREFSDELVPWLKDVANSANTDDAAAHTFQQVFDFFLSNTIGLLIGFNPRTAEKHTLTAGILSVQQVGGKEFARAFFSLMGTSPNRRDSNWRFAINKSQELQRRHQNISERITGKTESALGLQTSTMQSLFAVGRRKMLNAETWHIAILDLVSAVPTWMAQYSKMMEGRDAEYNAHLRSRGIAAPREGDAIEAADRAVRLAHGSTARTNKPTVMRGGPLLRAITTFYNLFNRVANKQYELGWRAKIALGYATDQQAIDAVRKGTPWLMMIFATVIAVGLIEELATPSQPTASWGHKHEPMWEQYAKGVISGAANSWIGARDFASSLMNHRMDVSFGLTSSEVQPYSQIIHDLGYKGYDPAHAGKVIKHANAAFGAATGYSNNTIGDMLEYVHDLLTGHAHPHNAGDWWRGMTKGQTHPREDRPDMIERFLRGVGADKTWK